jgi:hypothetical protein
MRPSMSPALRSATARAPVAVDADSVCRRRQWIAVSADPDQLRVRPFAHAASRVRGAWPPSTVRAVRPTASWCWTLRDRRRRGVISAVPSSMPDDLERIDLFLHGGPAVWRLASAETACSPAMPNGAFLDRPAPAGEVTASPNPFAPACGAVLRVAATPSPAVARIDAWVYDLEGYRVATLGGATSFPALFVWDGRRDDGAAVRPGLYLVAVELFQADGARMGVERVVVGCAAGDTC